jgi:E3 ubiquitin-protein ligase RNF216
MRNFDQKKTVNLCYAGMGSATVAVAAASASDRFTIDLVNNYDDPVIDIIEDDESMSDDCIIVTEKSDPNERDMPSKIASLKGSRTRKSMKRARNDIIDLEDDGSVAFAPPIDPSTQKRGRFDNDSNGHQKAEMTAAVQNEVEVVEQSRNPEYTILDVFPDVDLEYVKELLDKNNQDAAVVIQTIADNPKYPKSEKKIRTTNFDVTVPIMVEDAAVKNKYDYMSPQSFTPEFQYMKEATNRLLLDFPFLSKRGAQKLLMKSQHHYAICHDTILQTLKNTDATIRSSASVVQGSNAKNLEYERVLAALGAHRLSKPQVDAFEMLVHEIAGKSYKSAFVTVKWPRKPLRDATTLPEFAITDPILQEEVKFVENKLKEWLTGMKLHADRKARQVSAQQEKKAFDCACCFDSYHWDDLISCQNEATATNPHLFCADCICKMLESKIFGDGNLGYDKSTKELAIDLQCFHGDGCTFSFHQTSLAKVVPLNLLKKYEELQFNLSISKAGITSVHACPRCDYKCDVPDSQNVFSCPVANCLYESCRLCGEASHIPLRCDEVVKDRVETAGRTTVEEAISAAKIRECPSCKKSFIKSDGCNKIRCGCGAFLCYICREKIQDYSHFCQTPHCDHSNCKKCALYTNAEQDDLRAMREAGNNAAAQHKEANIDVDKIIGPTPVAAIPVPRV